MSQDSNNSIDVLLKQGRIKKSVDSNDFVKIETWKKRNSGYKDQSEEYLIRANDLAGNIDKTKELILTVPPGVFNTTIPYRKYNNCFIETPGTLIEIPPVGTIDPTNVSSLDANLIDNVTSNLVYNNNSPGSSNKPLPAIDLGSQINIAQISVFWHSSSAYTSPNFRIQGSNDGSTWVNLTTNLSSIGFQGTWMDISINGSYQYFRVFCITGTNPTWVVITEMKAYQTSNLYFLEKENNSDIEIRENNNLLQIINNKFINMNIKLTYHA